MGKNETLQVAGRQRGVLEAPTDLSYDAVEEIAGNLRRLLADVFTLYVKTKNFHWHIRGRHFRDYHLLLDEHAVQIFAMTDDIAERARKIGATTIRSISDIARHQRLEDNNEDMVTPEDMLRELETDNQHLMRSLRSTHEVCDLHHDVARLCERDLRLNKQDRYQDNYCFSSLIGVHLRPSAALAFVLPVIRRINSTSSTMYGVPSLRNTSWNQMDGSRSV